MAFDWDAAKTDAAGLSLEETVARAICRANDLKARVCEWPYCGCPNTWWPQMIKSAGAAVKAIAEYEERQPESQK
jgi:hypothetical protein